MTEIESQATEDDRVALSIDGNTVDLPILTTEQARTLARDLIETVEHIERAR